MTDLPLHNPAVASLAIQVAPMKRDRQDLERLIGRYGVEASLGQALTQTKTEIGLLSAKFQAIKRRR